MLRRVQKDLGRHDLIHNSAMLHSYLVLEYCAADCGLHAELCAFQVSQDHPLQTLKRDMPNLEHLQPWYSATCEQHFLFSSKVLPMCQ